MPGRLLHTGSLLMSYHHKLMPMAWSLLIDSAIFAAIYSHKPYLFGLHAIGAGAIGLITIITSFNSLLKGIPQNNPMRTHKLLGAFLYGLIVFQIIVGIFSWVCRSSPKRSNLSLKLKKIHKFVGFSLSLLAKLQVLYIIPSTDKMFWFNLLWDIASIAFLIYSKKARVNSESNPQLSLKIHTFRTIKSLSDISHDHPNTFMYGNYVYDCESLKSQHPAGYQIILEQKDQCLDRYIYGMIGPESLPQVKLHSHTTRALEMMSQPIAKLQVPEQYLNFSGDSFQVKIQSASTICQKSGLYVLKLKVENGQKIEYQGYSTIDQLGRYYSLTLNKQMTRLYTTVNFLLPQNVALVQKIFPKLAIPIKGQHDQEQHSSLEEVDCQIENEHTKQTTIPLMMKKYNNGRFTKKLLENEAGLLKLSCSKGRGLQLGNVTQGTVMLVAGGTGLFPFCDLIDLLFKQEIMADKPQYRNQILNRNKILQRSIFHDNTFEILIAANLATEIHPIILHQLRYLSQKPQRYKIFMKVKAEQGVDMSGFKVDRTPFQAIVRESLQHNRVTKILVCGPEKLNRTMSSLLREMNFDQYLIL